MLCQFPSIARSNKNEIAYEINTSPGFSSYNNPVATWAFEFYTGGDGMTKHAPAYAVQPENAADFLFSLVAYTQSLTGKSRAELGEMLRTYWPNDVTRALEAAYRVRYDANKYYRYFAFDDFSVSSAHGKQYDKRWKRIPEYADGSVQALVGLLSEKHEFAFQPLVKSLGLYIQATDFLREEKNEWVKREPFQQYEHLSLTPDVENAWRAVSELRDAYRSEQTAAGHLRNYLRRNGQEVEDAA